MSLDRDWPDPDRRDGALIRLLMACTRDLHFPNIPGRLDRRRSYYRRPRISKELTDKELLVLTALSHGLTLVDAADVTGFKFTWCQEAMKNIKHKLRAKTREQAVANALRRGLIH